MFKNIMKKLLMAGLFLCMSSCASKSSREPCLSEDVEPVSTCRAQERCRQQKASYGVGLGVGLGANMGLGISQSQNTESYTACIDSDLKDQETRAMIRKTEREISSEK